MAYNSAYTGSQVDAAVGAVRQKETKWDNKQDELTGTEDQLVGFNSAGEAVAVAKPDPLPAGGETGQVLTKTSTGAQWDDIPSDLPAGGTDGQILTKTADGVAWEDAPDTGVTSFKGRTGAVTPQDGDYTADMVGARPSTWTPTASDVGAVPTSRTVNGKALSRNISLTASDVGARANTWTPTASEVGAVPTSRTVNGKALSSNITLDADDVGALDQTSADARYLQLSGGTMTGALALPGNPTSDNQAANKAYVDALKPTRLTAVLSASSWSGNTQTVTVSGVSADETVQLIMPVPALASQTAYYEAGILVTGQAANSLTFTCQTAPTENITVYVVMQEVGA